MSLPIAQIHWAALRVPAFRAIAAMVSNVKVSFQSLVIVIVVSLSIVGIMTDQPNERTNEQRLQMIVVAVLYFRQRLLLCCCCCYRCLLAKTMI